jgi:hypothetical protein
VQHGWQDGFSSACEHGRGDPLTSPPFKPIGKLRREAFKAASNLEAELHAGPLGEKSISPRVAAPCLFALVWCNGSTSVSKTDGLGSNPGTFAISNEMMTCHATHQRLSRQQRPYRTAMGSLRFPLSEIHSAGRRSSMARSHRTRMAADRSVASLIHFET